MNDSRRRDFLKVAGGVAVVGGLAGCAGEAQEDGNGGGGQDGNQTDGQQEDQPQEDQPQEEQPEEEQPEDEQSQEGTGEDLIRIAHMVPDFPAVDVYVDDSEEPVFSGLEYTDVTGYVDLAAGDHQIRVTAAGSQGLVVFDQQVTIPAGNTTAVALPTPDSGMGGGQQGGGMDLGFQLQLYGDQNSPPEETINNSRVRVIHAAPDAPAVDVLVGQTTVFDNVAFGEAAYFDLPAGDYEFDVVPADAAAGGGGAGGGNGGGGGNGSNGDGGVFSQLGATSGGGISLLQEDGNETEEGQPPEEGEEEGEPETEPVLTFDASPAANSVYTVFVTGYLDPEAADSEAELVTVTVQDVAEGDPVEAEDE